MVCADVLSCSGWMVQQTQIKLCPNIKQDLIVKNASIKNEHRT